MRNPVLILFFIAQSLLLFSQTNFTPRTFLGYSIGQQFTRHYRVVDYFSALQAAFPQNIKVEKYGETYEKRDLLLAFIGSEENISRLEAIRLAHLNNDVSEKVSIVWLSYNVHGNESSGTEAAMQTAYLLVTKNKEYLKNTIVIIDPCLNPDGRDRYVNFYYQKGNFPPDIKRFSAEHNETWPGGRSNHYFFDLNRDWAWMTQIESQQRMIRYNQWLPHVHVDFHEQGINEPYYFPPAAEPYHEVITDWQRKFQKDIGKNNADYFDKEGWMYFSKEIFDLLYPSYGDTYPTYSGSIGMTFEQGGSGRAGLAVITQVGDTLTLQNRVDHHVTTGLSTVEMSSKNNDKLIKEYQSFCANKNYKYKSYVISGPQNKLQPLLELMKKNEIKVSFSKPTKFKGYNFKTGKIESKTSSQNDLIISTNQIKGTLVSVLFEPQTKLTDSLTYDITAWALPYAYGLEAWASEDLLEGNGSAFISHAKNSPNSDCYAYVCEWNSMKSSRFLAALQQKGIKVYFTEKQFIIEGKKYAPGTLILLRGENKAKSFDETIITLSNQLEISLTALKSGFVDEGNDFGASSVKHISKKSIGVLTGENTSSLSSGELWYFFEQELKYPVHMLLIEDLESALPSLSTLIVPEGQYQFSENKAVLDWIEKGGNLIVMGSAAESFAGNDVFGLKVKDKDSASSEKEMPYGDVERQQLSSIVNGAIYTCNLDFSHPLSFGYTDYFTLRMNSNVYELKEGSVFKLKKGAIPVSGFVGSNVAKKQTEALIAGVHSIGSGTVIYFLENPLFRGFWENGKLMLVNSIFMVN
jgi:hypothetical protein